MENKQKGVLIIGLGLVMFFAGVLVVSRYFDRSSEEKVGAVAVQKLSAIVPSPSQQPTEDPLVNVKPAPVWKNVCKNPSGGYEVKYPDEWSMVTAGNSIGESETVENCNLPKFSKGWVNSIVFLPKNLEQESEKISRITITAFPGSVRHVFADPNGTQEMLVDGEKMIWKDRDAARFLYHGNTEYNIVVSGGISEDFVRELFSTFKFLK